MSALQMRVERVKLNIVQGGGGHSNTSIVHIRDQKFRDLPVQGKTIPKQEFRMILHLLLLPKQDFLGTCLVE